jgi:hypothetical protein
MGLRDNLIEAKAQATLAAGANPDDINIDEGSAIYIEADLMTEAIVNFLTEANFTITQLKAPVIVETMKTPDLPVNIELKTLLGDKAPILDILKKIPGAKELVDELEGKLQKAVLPLLEGGDKLVGLDIGKDVGGLESTGYVYIGEDPDSQGGFNVEDEDGQREYTTVKLFAEDIERLL